MTLTCSECCRLPFAYLYDFVFVMHRLNCNNFNFFFYNNYCMLILGLAVKGYLKGNIFVTSLGVIKFTERLLIYELILGGILVIGLSFVVGCTAGKDLLDQMNYR